MTAMALSLRSKTAAFALQYDDVVSEFRRNPEATRRFTVQMPFLHKRDNSAAKYHRVWHTHPLPLHLLKNRDPQIILQGNPESVRSRHGLMPMFQAPVAGARNALPCFAELVRGSTEH